MWLFSTIEGVNKDIKAKQNLADNHVHNILRLFYGWASFPFTTSGIIVDKLVYASCLKSCRTT